MSTSTTEPDTKPAASRSRSSTRTRTVGVRLTPSELAALDTLLAAQKEPGWTRAGIAASIIISDLVKSRLLKPDAE